MQTYQQYLETMRAYNFNPSNFETWKNWQIHYHGFYRTEPEPGEMKTAITTGDTYHGNPGERRKLPAGTLVSIHPTNNLPDKRKWWATPVDPASVEPDIMQWAANVGILLEPDDVQIRE